MKKNNGIFTVSLDFELYWGIRDKKTIQEYGQNISGVWEVVPRLLKLYNQYGIHCTWAAVGAMMTGDFRDLQQYCPENTPSYLEKELSPYHDFIPSSREMEGLYLYGKELVELVQKARHQEIGSHTFSHYYCLEDGQTKDQFEADIEAAIAVSSAQKIEIQSFIFPRHQINNSYLEVLKKNGILIYRGTEKAWYHSPAKGSEEGVVKRAFRYLDYFVKVGSHHTQKTSDLHKDGFTVIRASRWLRPYSEKIKFLDGLKLRRIKQQMTYAAKNSEIFHLWFHPHDIGIHQDINFGYLEEIFQHYKKLNEKYNFQSKNMSEIAAEYEKK